MSLLPSFTYCAFRFLNQWQEDECALYSAIKASPTDEDIRRALNYFGVAWNFKGLKEPETVAFIRHSLVTVRADQAWPAPSDKVSKLAEIFEGRFDQYNLSAASKLLWLSFREPYIVLDNRAVRALTRDFGHEFDDRKYAEYSRIWRQEYGNHRANIQAAVEQLPNGQIFMRCPLPDGELLAMALQPWFLERIFDIFLWEVGADTED